MKKKLLGIKENLQVRWAIFWNGVIRGIQSENRVKLEGGDYILTLDFAHGLIIFKRLEE